MKLCEYITRAEFEDCDLGGVVYHPNYLNYFERARSAALKEKTERTFSDWVRAGVCLVVARMQVEFRRPVVFYDPVYVYTRWNPPSTRSVVVSQYITTEKLDLTVEVDLAKHPSIMTSAEFHLVCISLETKKSIGIPEGFLKEM